MRALIEHDSENINFVTENVLSKELLELAFRDKVVFKLKFLNLVFKIFLILTVGKALVLSANQRI